MRKSLLIKTKIKASTMVEMLVVMIIAGIVIGLTFEGVDIFRRYSRKITDEIVKGNDLLHQYQFLNTIVGKSDSLTFDDEAVMLYRRGTVFAELYLEDSVLLANFFNTVDTLPIKTGALEVKFGEQADTLFVGTKTMTLMFNTTEQPVLSTKKNNYDAE